MKIVLAIILAVSFRVVYLTPTESCPAMCTNRVELDTSFYAIIAYDSSMHWLFNEAKPAPLSGMEINAIEATLLDAVINYNKKVENEGFRIKPVENYKRQYVAVFNKKRQKEVWINFFCSPPGSNWRKSIFTVDDGGNCFFSIKINLITNRYYDLSVNGYA